MQFDLQEVERLIQTKVSLAKAYQKINQSINYSSDEYNNLKKYMVDYKNEMDKMEVFSYQQTLSSIDRSGVAKLTEKSKIEKLIESPYFGRFDFVYEGEEMEDAEIFYIGRFGFMDEHSNNLIYDWRASVCNIYYEYELGNAQYSIQQKTISGKLIKKRQFKIINGEFEYIIDSSLTIQDNVLQKTLSEYSNEKMKTIIASIQKDQNQIVRNEKAHTVIIQGVAGSGKTSVALHRIAYLLYKFRDTLSADKVLILSPNKVFGSYISSVLPELGEQPILDYTIDDLTKKLLPTKVTFTPFQDEITKVLENPKSKLSTRVEWKSSIDFLQQLDEFLKQLDNHIFKNEKIVIADYEIEADYLHRRFLSYTNESVKRRLELISDDVLAILKTKRNGELKLPSKNEIQKRLSKRLIYKSPLEVYRAFFVEADREDDFVFKKNHFEFSDVFPYLYCQLYFQGVDTFNQINHFVVDEMQDYAPIQYAVLQRIFPCKKTIIGDFGQSLVPFTQSSKEAFTLLFSNLEYLELTKSYRSSYEIIEYAKKFTGQNKIQAIERHGEKPQELAYVSKDEMIDLIRTSLNQFQASALKTCAIICKTEAQRNLLASHLRNYPLHVVDQNSEEFKDGITLVTIQYAKGLEFDQVLIPFIDEETYQAETDKDLLYIGCTRAMHSLTLYKSQINPSPLL